MRLRRDALCTAARQHLSNLRLDVSDPRGKLMVSGTVRPLADVELGIGNPWVASPCILDLHRSAAFTNVTDGWAVGARLGWKVSHAGHT